MAEEANGTTTDSLTRRDLLRVAGAAATATFTVGTATATDTDLTRVNVGYATDAGRAAVRAAATEIVHEFAFDVLTITVTERAAADLRTRPGVRFVEPDVELEAIAKVGPVDTDGQALPWGVDRVDAEVAHANGANGAGADVAVIDTGIDLSHPDLWANLGSGATVIGGGQTDTAVPGGQDDNGHGTHCAGIVGAADNGQGVVGVAPGATLHPVKALTATGVGFTADVAKGIEYTADQGWDVASLSLGGPSTQTLKAACEYAASRGVFLVAAAGNSGPCSDCVAAPAQYPEVVAVTATGSDDGFGLFSSTGPEVELAAPGIDISSTYLGGYRSLSGTSMACPHVAGAAAQLLARGYSRTDARTRLKDTAEDLGFSSNRTGAGLLDVASALGYASGNDF